jgi:nucleoside 2-deoxyribosyltransferase
MVKVYLAGSIWETDYRAYTTKTYGDKLHLLDPIKENGVTVDAENVTVVRDREGFEIVELDKEMIRNCDIFVAFIKEWTAGTLMEVMYAYERMCPIYIITDPTDVLHLDIWLTYHTTQNFDNIDECFNHILKQIECKDQQEQINKIK